MKWANKTPKNENLTTSQNLNQGDKKRSIFGSTTDPN